MFIDIPAALKEDVMALEMFDCVMFSARNLLACLDDVKKYLNNIMYRRLLHDTLLVKNSSVLIFVG